MDSNHSESQFWHQAAPDGVRATSKEHKSVGFEPKATGDEVVSGQTLGELLGISIEDAVGVDLYDVGSEPVTTAPRTPPRAAKVRRVSGGELDSYLAAARGGATDAEIARQARVSVRRVRRWRQRRGISRPRGRMPTEMRAAAAATELFSRPFEPVVSHVEGSVVRGRFEPPQYLLREPLRYDLFCGIVCALREAGFTAEEIARGMGLRLVDVEHAQALGGP